MLRRDLREARERWLQGSANSHELAKREKSDFLMYKSAIGEYADFHAFRHTFVTNLTRSGANIKVVQSLARHSTPSLTLGTYSHANHDETSKAIQALPSLDLIPATSVDPDLSPSLSPAERFGRISADQEGQESQFHDDVESPLKPMENADFEGKTAMGRAGIEPATHGFSIHCSTN